MFSKVGFANEIGRVCRERQLVSLREMMNYFRQTITKISFPRWTNCILKIRCVPILNAPE
jgi:hypothetical protein